MIRPQRVETGARLSTFHDWRTVMNDPLKIESLSLLLEAGQDVFIELDQAAVNRKHVLFDFVKNIRSQSQLKEGDDVALEDLIVQGRVWMSESQTVRFILEEQAMAVATALQNKQKVLVKISSIQKGKKPLFVLGLNAALPRLK